MGTPEVRRLRLTPARAFGLVLALLAALVAVGTQPLIGKAQAAGTPGTICHANNDAKNPYVLNTPSGNGQNGGADHMSHTGPIFNGSMHSGDNWGDIIPPGVYNGVEVAGLNWDAAGMAIWNRGCVYVGPALSLTKVLNSTNILPGDSVSWTLTLTNSASADPTYGTITVTDTLPAGWTGTISGPSGWSCASNTMTCTTDDVMAAGATATFAVSSTVPSNASGTFTNSGIATTPGSPDATASVTGSIGTQSVSLSPSCAAATGVVTWTVTKTPATNAVTVSLSGPAGTPSSMTIPAGQASDTFTTVEGSVTLTAPAGWTGPGAAVPSGACPVPTPKTLSLAPLCDSTTGTVTWTVTKSDPADAVTVTLSGPTGTPPTLTIAAGAVSGTFTSAEGSVTLTAPAGWTGPADPVPSGACTAPPATSPDMRLVKAVDAGNGTIVQPGQQLVYTLTYSNAGNGDASNVSITDALPANAEFVAVADGGSYDATAKVASWTIGNVAAGASGAVHWTVTVASGAAAGSAVTNVAMVGTTPSNTVTNPIAAGDLTLGKTVSDTTAEFGDTLTYTLTAAATGTMDQSHVVVSDVIPAGTTYVDGSADCASPCTASYDGTTKTVTWQVGDVNHGQSVPLTFSVTVDTPAADANGAIPAELITNVGSSSSDQVAGPVPSNEVVTTITAVLGVKITRKPPVVTPVVNPVVNPSRLPFTGATIPVPLLLQVGAALVLLGGLMLLLGRRRQGGRHLA